MDRERQAEREYTVGDRPEEGPEPRIYRTAREEPDTRPSEEELDRLERYLTDGCFCS